MKRLIVSSIQLKEIQSGGEEYQHMTPQEVFPKFFNSVADWTHISGSMWGNNAKGLASVSINWMRGSKGAAAEVVLREDTSPVAIYHVTSIHELQPFMPDEAYQQMADDFESISQGDAARPKANKGSKFYPADKIKGPVELYIVYEPYERYGHSPMKRATIKGKSMLEALKKMVGKLGLYFDVEDIEYDEMQPSEILDRIESENGDGCDAIFELKNKATGEVYIQLEGAMDEDEEW